jgi:hypothetical protein
MTRQRWRRRTISIAASLLAHLVLLTPLLLVAPNLRLTPASTRPDVQIDFVRLADVGRPIQRPAHQTPPSLTKATAGRPLTKNIAAAARALAQPRPFGPQTPASPSLAPTAPADDKGEAGAAGDAHVRAALRGALGCLNPDLANLTEAERAACRDRLHQAAADMGDATVDPIRSIRKRAYYDDVKAARDAMNSYNPVNGPMSGNGPGFGCKHGKCGFIPPSGALTEEWGIKPP